MNRQQAIVFATQQLKPISPSARLDAEALLIHVLKITRSALYTYLTQELVAEQLTDFERLLEARRTGLPIAYLIGHKEFWSLDLIVTPDTLIPRPETELLVENALTLFPKGSRCQVLELGTGSGAIALALAHERPEWQILATDIDEKALSVAQSNAQRLQVQNITFQQSNWYQELLAQGFDLIISNPPYVSESDTPYLSPEVHFEPKHALYAEEHGLQAINTIINGADRYLVTKGWLLVEHGFEQAQEVRKLMKSGYLSHIATYRDIAGIERITAGQKLEKD